ncbi:hypothetical protein HK103_002528 [Boothiomyces macroporosus]|uniref:Uncharacterized protein n=1 Tax=Boothiomyces macroporosus TaxID=261099 RepID=A0AAD5UJQ9_9FUNG|nr:hypothetical protein HK103_002528 [Boothiomyces macroporosus]
MAPKTKTSLAIQESIVRWLQIKDNFLLITGAAAFGSPVISGKKLKKKDAYASLAKAINEKNNTDLDADQAKAKYLWLIGKFKKANELSKTEENMEKIEEACPFFYKELNELFGQRQNINPFNILETSVEPIQIPERSTNIVVDENELSSSLGSVHISPIDNVAINVNNKRKTPEEIEIVESPKKKQTTSSNEKEQTNSKSPNNSKTNSSGKNGRADFTTSYITSQKEKWVMEKEYKEVEIKLQKEKFEKEVEFKHQEVEFKQKELQLHKVRLDKEVEIKEKEVEFKQQELQLHKTKLDKEVEIKEKELDANIKLRREEMEFQAKQSKMQLVKEMISQGKSHEEIKELLELLK